MAKHTLTVEDSAKGGRSRGKIALKLQRELKKRFGMEMNLEIITSLLSNQTITNTALFILIAEFWNPGKNAQNVGTSGAGTSLSSFGGWLNKLLFTPGGEFQALGITTSGSTLAKDLLLLSLAANIASGGNLSGILSSSTGFVSKLLPAAAAGA